jgi:hypothetical protein
VRDNLERGNEHIKKLKIGENPNIEELKTQFEQV